MQNLKDWESIALLPENSVTDAKSRKCLLGWNSDVRAGIQSSQHGINQSYQELYKGDADALSPAAHDTLKRFAIADTLAILYRRKLKYLGALVILLAWLGLIFLETAHYFAHLHFPSSHDYARYCIAAFVLLWLLVIGLNQYALSRLVQDRCQDYRTLAEGLRIQFFWIRAGIDKNTADCYPRRFRADITWILAALNFWSSPRSESKEDIQSTLLSLITNQLTYFSGDKSQEGVILRNHHRHDFFKLVGTILLRSSIVVLALSLVMPHGWDHGLIWLGGVLLVSAAACYAWNERSAYAEHVHSYSSMRDIYLKAQQILSTGQKSPDTLLRELGEEALSETTEWLLMHRHRHATEARL